jgi:hypothetical protein
MKLGIIDIEETIDSIDGRINGKLALLAVCDQENKKAFRQEAIATLAEVARVALAEIDWLNDLEE